MNVHKLENIVAVAGMAMLLYSCESEKKLVPEASPAAPEPVEAEVQAEPAEEPQTEPAVEEEVAVLAPEPEPEPEPPAPEPAEASVSDDEYARSVGGVHVSRDTFESDKTDVLDIIDHLSEIIKERNYSEWLKYLDPQSKAYWEVKANLSKAEKKLPVKGIRLKTLRDYFIYVFIPARAGRTVTEIRYVSDSSVKAVQVLESQDIVYYNFNKIKGSWKLYLPPIEN